MQPAALGFACVCVGAAMQLSGTIVILMPCCHARYKPPRCTKLSFLRKVSIFHEVVNLSLFVPPYIIRSLIQQFIGSFTTAFYIIYVACTVNFPLVFSYSCSLQGSDLHVILARGCCSIGREKEDQMQCEC